MSKAVRAALPFVALQVLGSAGLPEDITIFCRYACAGGKFTDSCSAGECPPPATGCSLYAYQPFHDDVVCSGYLKTHPDCDGTTQQCAEAASFQLVYDRGCDIHRTFEAGDFPGVALTFNDTGVLFAPGGTSFVIGRDAIAKVVEALHKKGASEVSATVNFVHSIGGNVASPDFIHSVGTWSAQKGADGNAAEWYAMWAPKDDQHWVMDVLVAAPTAPSAARLAAGSVAGVAEDPPIFKEIAARQAQFTEMYNAGNFTDLASEFFAGDAAIIPSVDRRPLTQQEAAAFFKELPLTKQAKMYPTIVTPSPDGSVVHEVGFSDSTATGYYARWIRKSEKDPWQMEVLCLAVFPQTAKSTELIV